MHIYTELHGHSNTLSVQITHTLCSHIPINDAEGIHKALTHPPSNPTHAVHTDTTYDTRHTHTCTNQTHNTWYTKFTRRQNMNGLLSKHIADIEHRLLTQNTHNAWHMQNTTTYTELHAVHNTHSEHKQCIPNAYNIRR
jgi:hypothetical protein